jgi:hypothetical protein
MIYKILFTYYVIAIPTLLTLFLNIRDKYWWEVPDWMAWLAGCIAISLVVLPAIQILLFIWSR